MRALATQPRYLAFDEGPFTFAEPHAVVAGVLTRGAHTVEAIVQGAVTVDGWDATETLAALARRLPGAGPDCLLVDGTGLGGLNLVDLDGLAAALGRPVFGVTRRVPDRAALEHAVWQAPEPERRLARLPNRPPQVVHLEGRVLHVQVATPDPQDAASLDLAAWLRPSMAEASMPEPLRLAHHVATAYVRGVSGTKP